jgi:hypothetical protein
VALPRAGEEPPAAHQPVGSTVPPGVRP